MERENYADDKAQIDQPLREQKATENFTELSGYGNRKQEQKEYKQFSSNLTTTFSRNTSELHLCPESLQSSQSVLLRNCF